MQNQLNDIGNQTVSLIDCTEESSEMTPDGEYTVEKILGKRETSKGLEYNIKWRDYHDPTWEPISNLTNASEMIKEFELNLRKSKELKKKDDKQTLKNQMTEKNKEIEIVFKEKGSFKFDTANRIIGARITPNKEIFCLVEWKPRLYGEISEPTYYSSKEIRDKDIKLLAEYYESLVKLPNFPNIV
jgi:hypothetical protein